MPVCNNSLLHNDATVNIAENTHSNTWEYGE